MAHSPECGEEIKVPTGNKTSNFGFGYGNWARGLLEWYHFAHNKGKG